MFCTKCGTENSAEAAFCHKCGNGLASVAAQPNSKVDVDRSGTDKAIWNPNAASNWSFLFTPAFGSYLQMQNWKTLGQPGKAASAKIWFYISLVMLAVFTSMNVMAANDDASGAANGLAILYLLVWYFVSGRGQAKYVKANFGSEYPRKSWVKPLLVGVVGLAGYMVIISAATVVATEQFDQASSAQTADETTQVAATEAPSAPVQGESSVKPVEVSAIAPVTHNEQPVLALVETGIPSCGDADATMLVSQILAERITDDTGFLEADFKKRVRFAVEQPVILAHDEAISRYTCKGTATYKVSETALDALRRSGADKSYQEKLWKNWRSLMGLYTVNDLSSLVTAFNETESEVKKNELRAQIAQILGIDVNFSEPLLAAATIAYPVAQVNNELQRQANLLDYALQSGDANTKKVPVEIHYAISKIDGPGADTEFTVEVNEAKLDGDLLSGIQNLEALISAAEMTEPVKVAAEQKAAVSMAQASPSSPPAQQVSFEATPQTVALSEAKKPIIEASFDCTKASNRIENLICSTPETANSDKRLSAAYEVAKARTADEKKLKFEQLTWMKQERNACQDSDCLTCSPRLVRR